MARNSRSRSWCTRNSAVSDDRRANGCAFQNGKAADIRIDFLPRKRFWNQHVPRPHSASRVLL